jgi:sulfite exporter TauE/SafE
MPDSAYLALFLVGLLGGTHCVGMCGGIVGALSLGAPARWSMHLAYNAGRIASYAVAGVLGRRARRRQPGARRAGAGAPGALSAGQPDAGGARPLPARRDPALAFTERAGQHLWRHIQPLTRRFVPARTVAQAFPLGVLWGWLPCGLVYSALTTALGAGSPGRGALLMLAFGLGTLPNLLLAGILLARANEFVRRPLVRMASGLLVLGFGIYGLLGLMRLLHWI